MIYQKVAAAAITSNLGNTVPTKGEEEEEEVENNYRDDGQLLVAWRYLFNRENPLRLCSSTRSRKKEVFWPCVHPPPRRQTLSFFSPQTDRQTTFYNSDLFLLDLFLLACVYTHVQSAFQYKRLNGRRINDPTNGGQFQVHPSSPILDFQDRMRTGISSLYLIHQSRNDQKGLITNISLCY